MILKKTRKSHHLALTSHLLLQTLLDTAFHTLVLVSNPIPYSKLNLVSKTIKIPSGKAVEVKLDFNLIKLFERLKHMTIIH